jgi:hypothetical protein
MSMKGQHLKPIKQTRSECRMTTRKFGKIKYTEVWTYVTYE